MQFANWTHLRGDTLHDSFVRHSSPYRHDDLTVTVRYSRGADFSGSCFYRDARIFVNLGRHNKYPYAMGTHIARAVGDRDSWTREIFRIELADAYQLALFIYLHELYHHLVHKAKRGVRHKEGMCDRFATRVLTREYGCRLTDARGRSVAREHWDFQDLDAFVAAAPRDPAALSAEPAPVPAAAARIASIPILIHGRGVPLPAGQLSLFDVG